MPIHNNVHTCIMYVDITIPSQLPSYKSEVPYTNNMKVLTSVKTVREHSAVSMKVL